MSTACGLPSPAIEGSVVAGAKPGDPFAGEVLRVLGLDVLRPLPKTGNQAAEVPAGYAQDTGSDLGSVVNGRGAFISEPLAKRYRLHPGSQLSVLAGDRPIELRVAGILPKTAGLDTSTLFVDIAAAQEMFGKVGKLDRIDCVVDPERLAEVKKKVEALLPAGARAIEPRVRTGEIERMLRSFQLNLAALSYVALLVGMYLIYNTIAIAVVQRKPEIGTLRAIGVTRFQIFRSFLGEGALFGALGSLAGLGLGALLAQFSVSAVSRTVDTLYVGSHADGVLYDPLLFLKAFVLGVIFATISAIAPALEAASTPPALAMRSAGAGFGTAPASRRWEIAALALLLLAWAASKLPALDAIPVFGYFSALCVIAGISLLAPRCVELLSAAMMGLARSIGGKLGLSLLLAGANTGSAVRRIAIAVAALMVAVGMVSSVAILIASFRTTVVAWADEALRADLFVRPLGLQDASDDPRFSPGVAERVRAVPGVAAVDTFRAITIPFHGGLTTVGATDFSAFSERNKLRILSGAAIAEIAAKLPGSNAVLASDPFAVRWGVHVGDTIRLETPSGPIDVRVAAIYNDYSTDSGVLIMDSRTFRRLYKDDSVNSLAIYAKPGVDLAELRSRIVRTVLPLRIDVQTNRELRSFVVAVFNRTFAITYALDVIAGIVAALGVVSTLFALVLERRREIAIVRYLGLSTAGVRSMVLGEAACVGFAGGVLGVLTGFLLGLLLVYVINRQAFGWLIELHVPWGELAAAVSLVVATALVAGLYPAALAARIRTATALRAE